MSALLEAMNRVLKEQRSLGKPLAIVLAGHNGSGKSTMWYRKDLANTFQIPLINADRMMLSILPESPLPKWAKDLRDNDATWMAVAQKGVETFTVLAMDKKASFAMETVFSHWKPLPCGGHESKIDKIGRASCRERV